MKFSVSDGAGKFPRIGTEQGIPWLPVAQRCLVETEQRVRDAF